MASLLRWAGLGQVDQYLLFLGPSCRKHQRQHVHVQQWFLHTVMQRDSAQSPPQCVGFHDLCMAGPLLVTVMIVPSLHRPSICRQQQGCRRHS